jgi:outer membrane receptor protein involved in Fe transport
VATRPSSVRLHHRSNPSIIHAARRHADGDRRDDSGAPRSATRTCIPRRSRQHHQRARNEQNYLSFFLQDTWQLGRRLTIKPGLRYEQQKLIGNLEEFTWDGNWAPRIGAVYDPIGDGRMKVFANWGRYFAKIPNDLAARALSADAGVTRADYFDAELTRPIPEGVSAADTETHFITAGLSAADFDPDSKSTYSDEWLVGAEYEWFPGVNFGINYTRGASAACSRTSARCR